MASRKTRNMAWWSERRKAREATLIETLATALGTALGRVFEAQSHQIEASSRFLDQLQDLSARKAAQIMGSKGGKVTARRKAEARKAKPSCALCEDPMRRGVTLEQISFHRLHEGRGGEAVPELPDQLPLTLNGSGQEP